MSSTRLPGKIMLQSKGKTMLEHMLERISHSTTEREHVTQYIWNNFEKYNIHRIDYEKNFSNLRFNLDYIEDYEFINKIFELLYDTKKYFLLKDIIGLLEMKKEIIRINQHIIPNLGLKKSIERDKLLGFK